MRKQRWWALCACLLALAARGAGGAQDAQAPPPTVVLVSVDGVIDLGLSPFIARALDEARARNADALVLDINTFGGRVDAAVAIRDVLVNAPVRTVAFVDQRAISAGALIALACETIVMSPGGTIGAAAPVTGAAEPAGEKTVSYVRKEFRATAEIRGRPTAFAEAMVDDSVEIEGVVAAGKLLTLTATEALEHGVSDHTAATLEAALAAAGLEGARVDALAPTWAESVVRFLTHPVISSLLMTVGLLGLIVEIRTPGFALPGVIGLLSLGLFFWGHWIVQLAGWEELLLVAIGLALLAIEIFILPGVTVAGLAGVVALVAGLALALVGAGATVATIVTALGRVAMAILVALAAGFLLLRLLPRLPFGRQLVLTTEVPADQGYVSPPRGDQSWLGRSGIASSPLRPAGIAHIDGVRVDVVSDGAFIEAGAAIDVIRVDGNRIVVRRSRTEDSDHD